jgi:salicylate hydroxylase
VTANGAVPVAIIGGGVGGLAAALSLLQAGCDVHVYEQARGLVETGAGINISPNASRLLHRLGFGAELARIGVRPTAWVQRRWDDGAILLRSPLGEAIEQAFGFPHYQVHRADLLTMLARALPPERLHLGHRFSAATEHDEHVAITFENGAVVRCGALIGADGIHSAVRHTLFERDAPRFTGCVAYRGMVPSERIGDLEPVADVFMGPGKHFVSYFVAAGRLVNFAAMVEQDAWLRESWTERGRVVDALAAFDGWHPQVRRIIGAADEIFILGLFDHAPLPRWSHGRTTLVGDACHPMLPFMAQGAAQAIEDGATLATSLRHAGAADVPAALARYDALRRPRASRLQALSQENKTRFHLPDGPAQRERDALMRSGATDWSVSAIAWLYAHDAGAPETAA